MKPIEEAVLSPREQKVYEGLSASLIDLGNNPELKALAKAVLQGTETFNLPDGTTICPTIEQVLVVNAIMAEKELAKRKGVKSIIDMQMMLGQVEEKATNMNVSLVDQDLAKRAIGGK